MHGDAGGSKKHAGTGAAAAPDQVLKEPAPGMHMYRFDLLMHFEGLIA
jgi:hypothetical protein